MRAYVLPDALAKLAGRFVWLDIDTENPGNGAFVTRFPIDAWPTLLVLDPDREQALLRWTGTATAPQIEKLALDGERALRAGKASRADAVLAEADRLSGERHHAQAAAEYRRAIAAGGPGWAHRQRAAEALVQSLSTAEKPEACAGAARELWPGLAPASAARVAAQGLSCALDVEPGPARDRGRAALEPAARRLVAAEGVLADDRSWLFDELSRSRKEAGDEAGARTWARRWLAFLDAEAARARTPLGRSAFDANRLEAARRLGDPGRVLPALLASERDLPGDFVPPTNLGVLYLDLGRPKDALAAADRALALAKGPRRVRVLVLRAQAQAALGERAAARDTLERALREGESFPESVRPNGYMRRAEKLLDELGRSS